MSKRTFIIRRSAAIGDMLTATIVADKIINEGHDVVFQSNLHCHPVLDHHPSIKGYEEPNGYCHVNLDGVVEGSPFKWTTTMGKIFLDYANQQLVSHGIRIDTKDDCPILSVSFHEAAMELQRLIHYPRPWVMINPRSIGRSNCNIPRSIIQQAASMINGSVLWIGLDDCPPGLIDCKVRDVGRLISLLSCADVLITPDTGPMHIASALGVPIVAIEQSVSIRLRLHESVNYIIVSADCECINCPFPFCPINIHYPPCFNINPVEIAIAANEQARKSMQHCPIHDCTFKSNSKHYHPNFRQTIFKPNTRINT